MTLKDELSAIIENCGRLLREDGPYKSLNASGFANVCKALNLEYQIGTNQYRDCRDVVARICALAVLAKGRDE